MSTMNIFDMSDLWNDGATTFSAIRMNVTDTASASGSLLMDLQVGGVSQFKVSKDGRINLHSGVDADRPSIQFGFAGYGISMDSNGWITSIINSTVYAAFGQSIVVGSSGSFAFGSTATVTNSFTRDVELRRDAANTLAQRNGVNAQVFRAYNSYTDVSNFERGKFAWESNVLRIGTEKAGTGTARALELQTDGVTRLTIASGGAATFAVSTTINTPGGAGTQALTVNRVIFAGEGFRTGNGFQNVFSNGADYNRGIGVSGSGLAITNGSTGGESLEFREMTAPAAPAANGVRIYAEDDGAGKTRLMALFATGAAQQIAIEP